MAKRILVSFLVFILVLSAQGQESQQTSDSTVMDSVAFARPITPAIYIDYGKLATYPLSFESKLEVGAELLIKEKIPLIVEFGTATLNPDKVYANGTYQAKGSYLRFGTGVYSQWQPKNKIGLTARYAISNFDEEATITEGSQRNLEDFLTASYSRTGVNASWLEFVLYSDAKLFSAPKFDDTFLNELMVIGLNLRFRYLLNYDLQTPDDVYSIPGYGHSFDKHLPAANLFLKVSF